MKNIINELENQNQILKDENKLLNDQVKKLIKDSIILNVNKEKDILVFFIDGISDKIEDDLGHYFNEICGIQTVIVPKGDLKLIKDTENSGQMQG